MRNSPTDSAPRSTAIGISSSISTLACRCIARAVRGLARHVADRRQPLRARRLHLGARLVAAQRLRVGVEDHLAAHAVDDQRHPGPDLVPEPLDADRRRAAPARAPRSPCATSARPPRCRSRPPPPAPAAPRRPATARARRRCSPWAPPRATPSRHPDQVAQQALADQRDVALAVAEVRDPRCARTPPGSGRAPCAPPTRRRPCPRGSCVRARSTRWTSDSISRWASRIRYWWSSPSWAAICCLDARQLRVGLAQRRARSARARRRPARRRCGARGSRRGSPSTCATPIAMPGRRAHAHQLQAASITRVDPLAEARVHQLGQRRDRGRRRRRPRTRSSSSRRAPPPASAGP